MRFRLLLPLVFAALLFAGCGSQGVKLSASDIAIVGSRHITQQMFDSALAEEKASLKAAGQSVPKAGSTQYATMKTNIIDVLVQQAEFAAEAEKLGLTVSAAEVQKQLVQLKKQYFGGSDKKYQAGLKKQGFTDAQVRDSLREKLLEQKIVKHVTKGVTATDSEIAAYYAQNITQYKQPETRKVREILVGKNKQALANQIYAQVKGGADFAALAKKYSQDPGSKDSGGNFTANKGSDVPEFDAAVFAQSAKAGDLLKPVKTAQYGWFVIQVLGPIVPAKTTPEKQAAASIKKQLDASKQQQALSDWVNTVAKSFCSGGKIKYQSGYQPSPDPCAALATAKQTTT